MKQRVPQKPYTIKLPSHKHSWVIAYLTDGFHTLVPLSLSIDTPEAGSTCNASSMQPDDDLEDSRGIRKNLRDISMQLTVSYAKFISRNNEL